MSTWDVAGWQELKALLDKGPPPAAFEARKKYDEWDDQIVKKMVFEILKEERKKDRWWNRIFVQFGTARWYIFGARGR